MKQVLLWGVSAALVVAATTATGYWLMTPGSASTIRPIGDLVPVELPLSRPARGSTGATEEIQAAARSDFAALAGTIRNADGKNPGTYFTRPRYAGYAGLCAAERVAVDLRYEPAIRVETVYRLIGSTEAPPVSLEADSPFAHYTALATANCATRTASSEWFSFGNAQDAWRAVHRLDTLIAAARSFRALDFTVRCDEPGGSKALCLNPRASLAALDPARITRLDIGREGIFRERPEQVTAIRSWTRVSLRRDYDGVVELAVAEMAPEGPRSESSSSSTAVVLITPKQPVIG